VAFAGNQGTACPSQSVQADVLEGPDTSSVCGCNCALSTPPTCATGAIAVKYDANFNHSPLSCGSTGNPATMAESTSCSTMLYTGNPLGYQSLDLSYTPPSPTGGTCTPSPLANTGNLTYASQDRICTPNTEPCTGSDCTPSFGAGWGVCISSAGSLSCPGTTFTTRHIVGGTATFTCSSTCSCQVTGTCPGTITLYTNNNCTGTEQSVPVNGTCLNGSNAYNSNNYASYEYTAGTPQSSCDPTGTSTAQNVGQSNVQTVCCTQ